MTETIAKQAAKPIASGDVGLQAFGDGARRRDLTAAVGAEAGHLKVAIEELAPGAADGDARYRLFGEEHVFVLDGAPTLRAGSETHELGPGFHACFPAGLRAAHRIVNASPAPCRFLVVAERTPHEVEVYPELGKARVHALAGAMIDFAPEASNDPLPPRSTEAMDWDEEHGAGTRFGGRSKHLSNVALGWGYRIGLLIESPAPGKRLAPRHYHLTEEEHAFMFDGRVTLLSGDQRHETKPGDYVCFPAGAPIGHSFLNAGDGPCSYLMIGERRRNDVCLYPDSRKVAVGGVGERGVILDLSSERRYWDGEQTT